MVLHDYKCHDCGLTIHDYPSVHHTDFIFHQHHGCPARLLELSWNRRPTHHSVHKSERAVVYYNPITGHTAYPGRNDVPMPDRYSKVGYERRELSSLRSIESFEKEQGVSSEVAHFDRGTGRGFDDSDPPPLPDTKSLGITFTTEPLDMNSTD